MQNHMTIPKFFQYNNFYVTTQTPKQFLENAKLYDYPKLYLFFFLQYNNFYVANPNPSTDHFSS